MSLLLIPSLAHAALRDLQSHGSDERLWLARAEPQPSGAAGRAPTTLFVRVRSDSNWQRLNPIESPVLGLANRGSQLAVLLSNGDWLLMTDTSPASGLPLPGKSHMVALGSDSKSLWAVGLIGTGGGPPPPSFAAVNSASRPATTARAASATAPGTAPSPASSRPTTAPASTGRLTLYRLGPQEWEAQGPLPDAIPAAEGVSLSLAVVGGLAVVAHRSDELIRVYRRTDRGRWEDVGDVKVPADLQDYKALEGLSGPVVWTRGPSGPGRLWIAPTSSDGGDGEGAAEPIERELPPAGRDAQADHAVAFANGALRMLWVEDNKIVEQRLNSKTGEPDGDAVALPLPAVSIEPVFHRWAQIVLMAALIFAMAASMRRRQEMQEASLDPAKLPLAPFSTRLAAGVVDLLPAIAAMWLAPVTPTHPKGIGELITTLIGFGVYLVLTTVIEVVAGRSLGKMVTGLRVVGLDGQPAPVGARVVRNLLRVIDFPIMPLALILFSPLRQRAGDLAAGTLVLASKTAEEAAPTADAEAAAGAAAGGADEAAARPKDETMAKPE